MNTNWKCNWNKVRSVQENGICSSSILERDVRLNNTKCGIRLTERRSARPDQNAKPLPVSAARTVFLEDVILNPLMVAELGNFVMIVNKYPVEQWHSLICTRFYLPQNDAVITDHVKEISLIFQVMGENGFTNQFNGAAASLNHHHSQLFPSRFPIRDMPVIEIDDKVSFVKNWGGNLVIKGSLDERINILDKLVKSYELHFLNFPKTVKADGTESDKHLYTLIFWENRIVFIPRKRESPQQFPETKFGGLELSGIFIAQSKSTYDAVTETNFLEAVKNVTYDQDTLNTIYQKSLVGL